MVAQFAENRQSSMTGDVVWGFVFGVGCGLRHLVGVGHTYGQTQTRTPSNTRRVAVH